MELARRLIGYKYHEPREFCSLPLFFLASRVPFIICWTVGARHLYREKTFKPKSTKAHTTATTHWNIEGLSAAAMLFTRGFSLTNFVIGSSALCFQVFVLYPWHEKLEMQFNDLHKAHEIMMHEASERHRQELAGIREEMEKMNKQKNRKGLFW